MNKERLITLSLIICAAAVSRLIPHPDNVTPVAAIALFAGAQFDRKALAFAVPLMAMFLSDIVIGFYPQVWLTYVAFALTVGMGFALRGRNRLVPVAVATLASAVLFFVVTNFAPLAVPAGIYPNSWEGIMQSYVAAIPFFRNSLIGDVFYSALLFGGFALAERKYRVLAAA